MVSNERGIEGLFVVDANHGDYGALVSRLSQQEIQCSLCSTGEDGLRAISSCQAALWIVNFRLPDMSGIGFMTLLRRRLRRSCVFLVTDEYSADDELAARSAGATAYVCKPPSATWLANCRPRCRSPAIRAGPFH
jgi:DNA-binding response OmpR family regulator